MNTAERCYICKPHGFTCEKNPQNPQNSRLIVDSETGNKTPVFNSIDSCPRVQKAKVEIMRKHKWLKL